MMKYRVAMTILVVSAVAVAQTAQTAPADAPTTAPAAEQAQIAPKTTPAPTTSTATTTTAPTTTSAPATDPAAMKILEQLEAAGKEHTTIQADLNYQVDDRLTGDREARTGSVLFQQAQQDKAGMFRITFATLRMGEGATVVDKVEYAFDGQWLSIAKHKIKQLTRIQVVKPGEKVEPLKLGEGPFPLPFGQQAAEVVRHFAVTTRKPAKNDPEGSSYLRLVPRDQGPQQETLYVEMWIDDKTHLPVKIVSRGKDKKTTTVAFAKTRTGVEFDDKTFLIAKPAGWQYEVKPLEEAGNLSVN